MFWILWGELIFVDFVITNHENLLLDIFSSTKIDLQRIVDFHKIHLHITSFYLNRCYTHF